MQKLTKKNIVIPENRMLDILAGLLEKHDANIIRCPMVSILDTPDKKSVLEWINRFIKEPFDIFIILTGEGLYRLVHFAETKEIKNEFINAIKLSKTLVRGPKPKKALSSVALTADFVAEQPTTDGVIATLSKFDIEGYNIGVQLYGTEPNTKLIEFLNSKGAIVFTVAPYIYAPETDDGKIKEVLKKMENGVVDMIAFTSQEQYKRLKKVASGFMDMEHFEQVLNSVSVASVGPVVSGLLESEGIKISVVPKDSYFIKPMVKAIVAYFNEQLQV